MAGEDEFGEDWFWDWLGAAGLAGNRDEPADGEFDGCLMAVGEDWVAGWGAGKKRKWNPKRAGELSQAAFLLKAASLGFGLAAPWGDSEKYDFIVSVNGGVRLVRVQVKATGRLNGGGYDVQPVYSSRGAGKKGYTAEQIDLLAAHVQGVDAWYLLPVGVIQGEKNLRLYPEAEARLRAKNARWEGYREAWGWLDGELNCDL
jgi:hypothetical protein